MILVAGCGAGQKTGSKETGQGDKPKTQDNGDIVFTEEEELPDMSTMIGISYK